MATEAVHRTWSGDIPVTINGAAFLRAAGRWAKFLAVVGFIFLTLGLLAVIGGGVFMADMLATPPFFPFQLSMGYLLVGYAVMLIIYFIPVFYLFSFASRVSRALKDQSRDYLTRAMHSLKVHYQVIGILAIIGILFYVIIMVSMLSMAF